MTLTELEQLSITQREELYSSMDGYNSSFVKKLIDNEATAIKTEDEIISPAHFDVGNLIEYIIQRGEEWVNNNIYFTETKKPDKVIGKITEAILLNSKDTESILAGDTELAKDYATRFGYGPTNWKAETILKKFEAGGVLEYLEAVKDADGRPIMSEESLFVAETSLNKCYTGSLGEEAATLSEEYGWKYLDQVPIQAELEVQGLTTPILFKILIDRLIYNPEKMIYKMLDFKSTAYCASSFLRAYLKQKYWVQGSLYTKVLAKWLKNLGEDAEIKPFKFIPISKAEVTTMSVPFEMSYSDIKAGWTGWTDANHYYRTGIRGAIYNREKLAEIYPDRSAPYPMRYDVYQNGGYLLRELC